jgi:hypothetical protein
MRITRLAAGAAVIIGLTATLGSDSAFGQSAKADDLKPVAATANSPVAPAKFATLKDVQVVPMTSRELDIVKGLHVHFLDAGKGKLHLAGDVKHMNNWKNIGGTDGLPVAPSYKGLCVSHAKGGIFIPTMGPITTECP